MEIDNLTGYNIIMIVCVITTLVMIFMTAKVYEDYNWTIEHYNQCVNYSRGFAEYIGSNETFNRYISDRLDGRIISGMIR